MPEASEVARPAAWAIDFRQARPGPPIGLPARDCWSGSDPEAAEWGVHIPARRDARTGHRNRRVAPGHGPKARIGTGDPAAVAQLQGGQRHAEPARCSSQMQVPCTWILMSHAHHPFDTGGPDLSP